MKKRVTTNKKANVENESEVEGAALEGEEEEDEEYQPTTQELAMCLISAYELFIEFDRLRRILLEALEDGQLSEFGGSFAERIDQEGRNLFRTIEIIHALELVLAVRRSPA